MLNDLSIIFTCLPLIFLWEGIRKKKLVCNNMRYSACASWHTDLQLIWLRHYKRTKINEMYINSINKEKYYTT